MDKNQWLAEKVMKFGVSTEWRNGDVSNCIVYSKEGYEVSKDGWSPDDNIEQAMMLLDEFSNYTIRKKAAGDHPYLCEVESSGHVSGYASINRLQAINEAVLMESGFYNE